MPMNTTCVTRSPKCSSRCTIWSTISCVARLRANPPFPVAQKVHRIGHPTCDDTHAVSLLRPASFAGIPTVSTTLSSWSLKRSLVVPSVDAATWCTVDLPTTTPASISCCLAALGRVEQSSMAFTGLTPYRWSRSCLPRNAGSPASLAKSLSSGRVMPRRLYVGSTPLRSFFAPSPLSRRSMSFVEVDRAKVTSASPWDSRTSLSSSSFHSPSCTPSARGTSKVGSAAAVRTTLPRRPRPRRAVALGRAVARPEEEAARTRVSRWALEAANTAAPLVQGALEVAMALGRMEHKKRVDSRTGKPIFVGRLRICVQMPVQMPRV